MEGIYILEEMGVEGVETVEAVAREILELGEEKVGSLVGEAEEGEQGMEVVVEGVMVEGVMVREEASEKWGRMVSRGGMAGRGEEEMEAESEHARHTMM